MHSHKTDGMTVSSLDTETQVTGLSSIYTTTSGQGSSDLPVCDSSSIRCQKGKIDWPQTEKETPGLFYLYA